MPEFGSRGRRRSAALPGGGDHNPRLHLPSREEETCPSGLELVSGREALPTGESHASEVGGQAGGVGWGGRGQRGPRCARRAWVVRGPGCARRAQQRRRGPCRISRTSEALRLAAVGRRLLTWAPPPASLPALCGTLGRVPMSTHTLLVAAPPPGESLPLQFSRQLQSSAGEGGESEAQLILLGCCLSIPTHFNQVQNLHVSPAVSPSAAGAQTSSTSWSLISYYHRLIVDLQMSPTCCMLLLQSPPPPLTQSSGSTQPPCRSHV